MADGDQIAAEEYVSWVPAPEAIRRVSKAMGDWGVAAKTILRRLAAGHLRAHFKAGDVERNGKLTPLKTFGAVPERIAKAWDSSDYPATWQFWTSGDTELTLRGQGDYGYETDYDWRFFGIRFDPAGIEELAPAAPKPEAPADKVPVLAMGPPDAVPLPPARARAGRLPKDFWEDMVIAAAQAMWFDATLQPKTQADMFRWLAEWCGTNLRPNDMPGDTALKERARKLFRVWEESRK